MRGYDDDNNAVVENHAEQEFTKKLISVERIQSITEEYILVTSSHDRDMYWEYDCTMQELAIRLSKSGMIMVWPAKFGVGVKTPPTSNRSLPERRRRFSCPAPKRLPEVRYITITTAGRDLLNSYLCVDQVTDSNGVARFVKLLLEACLLRTAKKSRRISIWRDFFCLLFFASISDGS